MVDVDRPLLIGTTSHWEPIDGEFRVSEPPPHGRESDVLDIAYRRIDAAFAEKLDGCSFLNARQVARGNSYDRETPFQDKYVALGWPLNRLGYSRTLRATDPKNLTYIGNEVPSSDYATAGIDSRSRLAIDFNHKVVFNRDGATHQAPMVKGLSGGALIHTPLDLRRTSEQAQLVAITVSEDPARRLMIGTRLDAFFWAIDHDQKYAP